MQYGLFGYCNEYLRRYPAGEALDLIRDMGYSFIEPGHSDELYTPEFLPVLKEALDARGMSLCCYSVGVDLSKEGEEEWERLMRAMDNAAYLGSPYVHHTLVPDLKKKADKQKIAGTVIEKLKRSCEVAAGKGLTVLVENQGLVFNGVEALSELFEAVNSDNLYFCSDLGNTLFVDEDPLTTVKAFLNRTKHVHIKDYRFLASGDAQYHSYGGKGFEEVMPGDGDLPLAECLRLLSPLDVRFSMEYSRPNADCRQALERVKGML